MKKFALVLCVVLSLALCSTGFAASIAPLQSLDMENISDCMLPVSFNIADVTDKEIFALLYEEVMYDIVDVAQLAVGDTITTDQGDVVVESIVNEDGCVNINGGMDDGGITLYTIEDSNGYFLMDYEFIANILRGQAQLTFADTVTVNVYKMAEDLSIADECYDTFELPAAEVAGKLTEIASKLGDDFIPYNTTVEMVGDLLTTITIDYMP